MPVNRPDTFTVRVPGAKVSRRVEVHPVGEGARFEGPVMLRPPIRAVDPVVLGEDEGTLVHV